MSACYVIEIEDYPVNVQIGYYPQERLAGQVVRVSICATIRTETNSHEFQVADDLGAIVDYTKLMAVIDNSIEGQEIQLVERAVSLVGHNLLKAFERIEACDVRIEKPVLPGGVGKGAKVSVKSHFKRS